MTYSVICNTQASIVSGGHSLMVMTIAIIKKVSSLEPHTVMTLRIKIWLAKNIKFLRKHWLKDITFEKTKKNRQIGENGKQNPITSDLVYHFYCLRNRKKERFITHLGGGSDLHNSIKKSSAALTTWLKPCKVKNCACHLNISNLLNFVWISCNSKIYTDKPVAN